MFLDIVDLHIIGDINGEYIIDTNACQAVDYEGAIWAQTFLRNSTEMLADSKFIRDVIGKEVENRGKHRIQVFAGIPFLLFRLRALHLC
jgi:hypothetical protein